MSDSGDTSDGGKASEAISLIVRATADALNKAIEDAAKLGLEVRVEVARVSDGVGRLPQIRVEAQEKGEE